MNRTVRLVVEQAGPLTTIQDSGRAGRARFGIPQSGPVDRLSFAAAQRAVGNPADAAAIELSLGGLTLRCIEGETRFAVCGGDFTAERDGQALGGWIAAWLGPGMRLRIRQQGAGNWAYLTFGGRLAARSWLGSVATHALAGLGGGRVCAGQALEIDAEPATADVTVLPRFAMAHHPIARARLVLGPQDRFFTADTVAMLFHTTFTASTVFDRMGMMLEGAPLIPTGLDMPSEPASRGSLQVDGAGKLTLLLADHQTAGGYPKIATVLGADADRIAQLPAGSRILFEALDPAQANAAARLEAAARTDYLASVANPRSLSSRLWTENLIGGAVDATAESGVSDDVSPN